MVKVGEDVLRHSTEVALSTNLSCLILHGLLLLSLANAERSYTASVALRLIILLLLSCRTNLMILVSLLLDQLELLVLLLLLG